MKVDVDSAPATSQRFSVRAVPTALLVDHGRVNDNQGGAIMTSIFVDPDLAAIRRVTPRTLRLCLSCGHVGCCDSSPMRHARRHAHTVGHPIVRSFEPGESWRWCYVHEIYV